MKWILALFAVGIMIGMQYAQVVDADAEGIDVSFVSDPLFADVNRPLNLNNATHADSVIAEWQNDMGSQMPNGTYYGSLTQPALFQHNIRPVEIHPTDSLVYSVNNETARFTTVIVSAHFNWSRQVLMSGCSEWWVRIPVHPDSIGDFAYLAIFKDVANASLIDFYTFYNYSYQFAAWEFFPDIVRPTYNGEMPQDIFKYMNRQPYYFYYTFDHGEMVESQDHIYLKVHSILRPETDYVISYAFYIPAGKKLMTYWNTGEHPCGGWSAIAVSETETYRLDYTPFDHYYQTRVLDTQKMEVALDLDYSFIFTEGIGPGGLFGVKFNFKSATRNCTSTIPLFVNVWAGIVTYPFYNTSMGDNEYISTMLPFISSDTIYCVPWVENAITYNVIYMDGSTAEIGWMFEGGSVRSVPAYGWNYSDFILFSTSRKIDIDTWSENLPVRDKLMWDVKVSYLFYQNVTTSEYTDDFNLTLLCYEPPRVVHYWSEIDLNFDGSDWNEYFNSTINPWLRPYVFTWDGREFGPEGTDLDYKTHIGMTYNYLGYSIWQSCRGTDGQWAVRSTTPTGETVYSYYFPQIIYISSQEWKVSSGNETKDVPTTEWGKYWQQAQDAWATGHYFKAIYYAIRGTISYIFKGIPGMIMDALHSVWDKIKEFGNWLYTKIVEFVGKIYDFLQDVGDNLIKFWDSAKYAVAPMMMVMMVGITTRFARSLRRDT